MQYLTKNKNEKNENVRILQDIDSDIATKKEECSIIKQKTLKKKERNDERNEHEKEEVWCCDVNIVLNGKKKAVHRLFQDICFELLPMDWAIIHKMLFHSLAWGGIVFFQSGLIGVKKNVIGALTKKMRKNSKFLLSQKNK